ncbi:DUF6225 family protein [Streptomyces sp. NPDC058052]|uniref:DUF6225 family protein n=1 Tax=Streptomyces sp. NPDC058052 TaxID=3346316 RepID=UPI0036EC3276
MGESGAEYEHLPVVWTVGRLREVLKDVPDDALVHVAVAPYAGAEGFDDRVLVGYAAATVVRAATGEAPARREVEHTLFADWPAGRYPDEEGGATEEP